MFAKVFTQILSSSLAEDYQVRLVFEDLLKLAGKDGVVDMTREAIARHTNVPLEIVTRGLAELQRPDSSSRTPDMQGRRIVLLDEHRDWGWRIVNYQKYRESATVEMLRMAERERKAEYRRRKGFSSDSSSQQSTEEEADAERSTDMSGTIRKKPNVFTIPSLEDMKLHGAKIGLPEDEVVKCHAYYESNGWRVGRNPMKSWQAAMVNWRGNWQKNHTTSHVNGGRPMSIMDLKTVIQAKESEAQRIKQRYSNEGNLGATWTDQGKLNEWKKLKSEIRQLNQKIASYA